MTFERRGQLVLVTCSPFLLGRGAACDHVISHDSISRVHARFIYTAAGWAVEDLGSCGGIGVDGQHAHGPRVIAPGMEIRIGCEVLRIVTIGDAPSPGPPGGAGSASR